MELATVSQGRVRADHIADNCLLDCWNLYFRFEFSVYGFQTKFLFVDLNVSEFLDLKFGKIDVGYCH